MTDKTSQQDMEAFEAWFRAEHSMPDWCEVNFEGIGVIDQFKGWQAALKHAQQAVEIERDKVLEEAARACEQNYTGLGGPPDDPHPDAILHNGCVHDCARAIRALQSQQPAQVDKPDIESTHAARAIAAYEASGATTPWTYLDPTEWSKWEKIADAVHAITKEEPT